MSIEQTDKIDFMGINRETGKVRLAISDHLEWINPNEHLLLLEDKINSYLEFIESGQVYDALPASQGKQFEFEIICKYGPGNEAQGFLSKVKALLESSGYGLHVSIIGEDSKDS